MPGKLTQLLYFNGPLEGTSDLYIRAQSQQTCVGFFMGPSAPVSGVFPSPHPLLVLQNIHVGDAHE